MIKYDKDKLNAIPIDTIVERETGRKITGSGKTLQCLCPLHDDKKSPSFKMDMHENKWHCFGACNTGGDNIAFIMKYRNMDFQEACKHLSDIYDRSAASETQGRKSTAKGRPPRPLIPIPEDVDEETLIKYISNKFWQGKYGEYKTHWTYKTFNGGRAYFDVRFETEDGSKNVVPFYYSNKGWCNKQPYDVLKKDIILFNLDKLWSEPNKPALIVEGCKCAHDTHFAGLHEKFILTTWPGGANGVDKLNVQPLQDRKVYIWPDNDTFGSKFEKAGYVAAYRFLESLKGNTDVTVLKAAESPSGGDIGKGYDIFDYVQDGGDPVEYIENPENRLSRERVRVLAGVIEDAPVMSDFRADGKFTVLEAPDENTIRKIRAVLSKNEKDHSVKKTDSNILAIVRNDPSFSKIVAYDVATNDIKFSSKYAELSQLTNSMWQYCLTHYGIGPDIRQRNDMISTVAFKNIFNSLELFMNELKKEMFGDEPPHFERNPLHDILDHITFCLEPDYPNYKDIYKFYFELFDKFFIRMFLKIQCIINGDHTNMPPADIVPILEGSQGIGKSRLCYYLSYNPNQFYVDTSELELTSSRDTVSKIRGKLIGELGELAGLKRTEIESIKAFISAIFDEIRRLYSEATVKTPRSISFIGTTNEDLYLRDTTGNRRFWPVRIDSIKEELFIKKELVRALYVYYMERAAAAIQEDKIQAELHISSGLFQFAQYMREEKRVKPMYLDKIVKFIEKLELETWSEEPVMVNVGDVADQMPVESSKAPAQFRKELKIELERRGYVNQKKWVEGRQRWYYVLEGRMCYSCNKVDKDVNKHEINRFPMYLCEACYEKEKQETEPF